MTQLERVPPLVQAMLRLPVFASLPGSVLEEILAHVYSGRRTGTYDFADVVNQSIGTGWQVKSTRIKTPVTWKRAKLPDKGPLIEGSKKDSTGAQRLGDAIIALCNAAAQHSVKEYGLKRLVYARLIDYMDGRLIYFERELLIDQPLFNAADFTWFWSKTKKVTKKEQLQAFHGVHKPTERAWFAWLGLGENQLHFKGESAWWPPAGDPTRIDFRRSGSPLTLLELASLIASSHLTNINPP